MSEVDALSMYVNNNDVAVLIDGLNKKGGGADGLSGISLSITKKGTHGILGPRGSGKTALLDAISGTVPFDDGSIEIFGNVITPNLAKSLKSAELASIKKRVGYVRGEDGFYPELTASETLEFIGKVKGVESGKLTRQIKEALSLVGLDNYGDVLVVNLDIYSRRLLAIAASLLGNPDVILVDEPYVFTLGEMREKREHIYGILTMLGRIKTVIVATSDFDVAKAVCSDVAIISAGKLLAVGSFEELEGRLAEKGGATLKELYKSLTVTSVNSAFDTENGGKE